MAKLIIEIFSGIVLTADKSTLYACTTDSFYSISKYTRNTAENKWEKVEDLLRSPTDDTEVVLQLKLDKHEKVLFGKYTFCSRSRMRTFERIYYYNQQQARVTVSLYGILTMKAA